MDQLSQNLPGIIALALIVGVCAFAGIRVGPRFLIRRIAGVIFVLFGVTFIFFVVGLAFTHAYVRPVWLKCAIIALPFLAIAIDVSSWYLIKLFHPFAWVEIGAGAAMAACFAVMWLTTLYQMWFMKPPEAILRRLGGDIPLA